MISTLGVASFLSSFETRWSQRSDKSIGPTLSDTDDVVYFGPILEA